MTRKNGTMIEKSQTMLVFENDPGGYFAADDFAEETGLIQVSQIFAF